VRSLKGEKKILPQPNAVELIFTIQKHLKERHILAKGNAPENVGQRIISEP
jgi:hypothetical protein